MKYCTVCKAKYDDNVSFCATDGEVLEDDPTSFVGSVLDGQYQIESLLGKGGMGAVFLARHILLGDRVAIKILPPEVRTNAEWLRRFRREGQAARRFRHPNAVTVYDLRTASDGTIYMVMEYVEGHTLDAELKKRGRFTAGEAFEILEPVMSVLNTAHAMGVVHRDLKPENIMIGKVQTNGEAPIKLLDLGIAKMREIAGAETTGTTELTVAGQVLGTPYYMSPEQWGEISRDGNPEIDGRTDIYSLGLVAYQMISGQRPYSAATLHELRREHIAVTPTPLVEKIPDVPRAFSDAIDRAIAKDRGDRQSTAGELAEQLRAALADSNGQAPSGRTFPDIPRAESSHSHTQESPGVLTKSDVNAATIVTVDAVPTTPPSVPPPDSPPPSSGGAPAVSDMSSSVTVVRENEPRVTPEKSGSKVPVLIGAGVLVLVLAAVAVGGLFAFSWFKAKPNPDDTRKAAATSGTKTSVSPIEFGRFWLQVPEEGKPDAIRAGDPVAMKSGQDFKFHFFPRQNGYLYIIGPGEQNLPTAFLTSKPAAESVLKTNEVKSGQDFTFPADSSTKFHWITLDEAPGTENYTIIFSPQPLAAPLFLREQATGKPLNETEQSELKEFLAKYKKEPVTELNTKDASAPFVTVKVAPAETSGAPLVFDVRIQHE
jgi:serine/threonine-protein kinase